MRLIVFAIVIDLIASALAGWRIYDHLRDLAEMSRLRHLQPETPQVFSAGMVTQVPVPARRFFLFSIAEGTPLPPVADLTG